MNKKKHSHEPETNSHFVGTRRRRRRRCHCRKECAGGHQEHGCTCAVGVSIYPLLHTEHATQRSTQRNIHKHCYGALAYALTTEQNGGNSNNIKQQYRTNTDNRLRWQPHTAGNRWEREYSIRARSRDVGGEGYGFGIVYISYVYQACNTLTAPWQLYELDGRFVGGMLHVHITDYKYIHNCDGCSNQQVHKVLFRVVPVFVALIWVVLSVCDISE